ncbi:MAG: hypothetical protein ACU83N_16320 [Gammaproteobacteria bacterium]
MLKFEWRTQPAPSRGDATPVRVSSSIVRTALVIGHTPSIRHII